MELKSLAAKPQLTKIELTDEDIVASYGEPVVFYTWDRQDMDTFVKLATLDYTDMRSVTEVVKNLVLDSEGKPVISEDNVLPTSILMRAINKLVEELGKSVSLPGATTTTASK